MNQHNVRKLADLCSAFKALCFAPGKAQTYEGMLAWARANHKDGLAALCAGAGDALDDLEADFNRMCIGPYRLTVPPYESVWFGTRVMNTRRTEVVRWFYAQAGLVSNPKEFNEPADYFGYELEFIGFLAAWSAELLAAGKADDAAGVIDWGNVFWAEHLGHWYAKFLEAVAADSTVETIRCWAQTLKSGLADCFEGIPLKSMTTGLEEQKVAAPKPIHKDDPS